tara:strand:- start:72 stop:689 length:618 start_codon:yes stop_codon:yes gene_type:complete
MAGLLTTFSNFGRLIGALYPTFIVSFLVLASIFNLKLNGLVYLMGIMVTVVICYLVGMTGVIAERSDNASIACDLFSLGSHNFKGPSTQVAISWFTFMYLLWPMLPPAQPNGLVNFMVIAITSFFALINTIFQKNNGCSNWSGVILGGFIGILLASGWFWIWWGTGHHDLLFYNELLSNNAICSRPSKQTFKCEVWKGGQLISQM